MSDSRKSEQACDSCRRLKKGCDKALPECALCVRMRRICRYGGSPPTSAAQQFEFLQHRVTLLEDQLSDLRASSGAQSHRTSPMSGMDDTSSRLGDALVYVPYDHPSTLFFLDVDLSLKRAIQLPTFNLPIPDKIKNILGDGLQVRTIIGAYFFSVQSWMAMVSKKKLYRDLDLNGVQALDISLLVLCMKLINDKSWSASKDPCTSLYSIAKEYQWMIQSSGVTTLRLLQASFLIALYEFGHAIYPAAYMTLGQCARLGQAIGLHDTGVIPQINPEPETWDEKEERRRTWWGVFILDRHICLGNPSRSMACAEPGRGVYLPVDDTAWDQGEPIYSEPLFISSSTNISAAPYARLGQATHLLSLVLAHINDHLETPKYQIESANQLARAILALCTFLEDEAPKRPTMVYSPLGVCYSALMILYEYHLNLAVNAESSSDIEKGFHSCALDGISDVILKVVSYASHIQTILPFNADQISPLIIHCLYRTANRIIQSGVDLRRENLDHALAVVMSTLRKTDQRWRLGGEHSSLYLRSSC